MLRHAVTASQPFDVVIIDQQMPKWSCLHDIISDEPALRATRVVLLTSAFGPTQGIQPWKLGWVEHVTKPVRQSDLLQCLAAALDVATPALVATTLLPAPATPLHKRHILLADDNSVNQKVAYRLLEKLGYRIDVVADGQAALDAWRSGNYDLILMDCQMPELDGFEATRRIRAAETADRRIPIVALTAHAMKGVEDECLAAGMDGYLSKPIHRELLRDCLERHLGAPASDQPVAEPATAQASQWREDVG
jgi:CheY-like chemotaxis protein